MKLNRHIIAACIAGTACLQGAAAASPLASNLALIHTDDRFTADPHILDRACVMVELYYRMDEDEALLYDPEEPSVVFGRIAMRNLPARQAEDSLTRVKASLRLRAVSLAVGSPDTWNEDQKALRALLPAAWSPEQIAASADRAVAKRGMRKTFRQSLERSWPWKNYMDSVFRAHGAPSRLMYLAHIESWFKPNAVSPAGAAGIFQFLETSGSRYLTIDALQDQRFDPLHASVAAAKFLKSCHRYLGSWPLAIMAYNNGPGQIQDAMRETGSSDPSEIIRNYEGLGFRTVSRNYYAMFLAVSSLAMRAETLFPGLRGQGPSPYKTLRLENGGWTPSQLRVLSGYSTAVIRRYNPALRPVVFDRNLPLPKGFDLRLPAGLPSRQDLQFADLRIEGAVAPVHAGRETAAAEEERLGGVPVPAAVGRALGRVRKALFPGRREENLPVMAYMHSQGLLDAGRLALARKDSLLIEPHPALLPAIRNSGG